jgi:hypothetical protein
MLRKDQIEAIIQENSKRKTILFSFYDPVTGEGSPLERRKFSYTLKGERFTYHIPLSMYNSAPKLFDLIEAHNSIEDFITGSGQPLNKTYITQVLNALDNIRYNHDFEYWAFRNVKIQDKKTKKIIPFKLNQPQRKLLLALEKMRLDEVPIRLILLKARQWGGSTLTQIYMAWIQVIHRTNWHSVVVADIEEQARNINGMYSRFAREYPKSMGELILVPYERSSKSRIIQGRDCVMSIGSAQKPDNLRSHDLAMCHFSEVGFFKDTPQRSPEDLVQSIRAAVADVPYSLIVLESTAKGVGNFFHREWMSATSHEGGYTPVFVAWWEIEMYQKECSNKEQFAEWVFTDSYAQFLWNQGATLEGINWYFDLKRRENYSDWMMQSEFPSTDTEAFISTGSRVFAPDYVKSARKSCIPPSYTGDISGASMKGKDALKDIIFQENIMGLLFIWQLPDSEEAISDRYVVTVDIGGRTKNADYSVIKVFDRYWQKDGGKPEVVAVWRGHLDQDLVAWKAAQIAKFYNNALLIVESNSLDRDEQEGTGGEHFLTVLDEIVKFYKNLYARTNPETIRLGLPIKYGFHTDRSTKPMVIDELNGALREEAYIERDMRTANEMDCYEVKPDGKYGATEGSNDDLVMATAIGVWACFKAMPVPKMVVRDSKSYSKKIVGAASI